MIRKLERLICFAILAVAVLFCFTHKVGFVYGADGLFVKAGNKVGIGTDAPIRRLDVSGDIYLRGGDANGNANIWLATGASIEDQPWSGGLYFSKTNGPIYFRSGTGNPIRMSVGTDGNIGIGTTIPGALLEIKETSGTPRIGTSSNPNGWGLSFGGFHETGLTAGGYVQVVGPSSNKLALQPTSGNVGVGTVNPPMKFYVNGSAGGITIWSASDRSWKKDIKTITKALEGIMNIRGVQYKWKNGSVDQATGYDDKTHYGVIAQEVEEVFPYLVGNLSESIDGKKVGKHDGKYVEYNALMGILIEAVKELKTENDAIKKIVLTMKEENKTLNAENRQLKNALSLLTDRQAALEEMFLANSTTLSNEKLAKLDEVQE